MLCIYDGGMPVARTMAIEVGMSAKAGADALGESAFWSTLFERKGVRRIAVVLGHTRGNGGGEEDGDEGLELHYGGLGGIVRIQTILSNRVAGEIDRRQ